MSSILGRFILKTSAFCLLGLLVATLFAGCSKSSPPVKTTVSADTNADSSPVATTAPAPAADSGPGPGEKTCFACQGSGQVKCMAPGCVNGMVDCPGPCLKLDQGVWIHMVVADHPPTDLWHKFELPDGSGYMAYNQSHAGHVIAYQNGQFVDTGSCKICGGSGKVPCSVCKGTGKEVCPICEGKKFIPVAWTPTDNPWLDGQPDLIRLASGKLMFGKAIYTNGTDLTVKTRDGKFTHIKSTDIVPNKNLVTTPL